VRRSPGKCRGKRKKVEIVTSFEFSFSDQVLFCVMCAAQTDSPLIRRFEALPAIGTSPHVSALDRKREAPGDRTVVTTDPGSMCGTTSVLILQLWAFDAGRKSHLNHAPRPR
jgi:hypothetical protein